MIVPIKFRGRDINGKMRFGHCATTGGYPYIIEDHMWCEVEPDTVAQLVGYSKDGREIYDGDIVIDGYGNEYVAEIWSVYADAEESKKFLDNGKLNFTLKD